MIPLKWAAIADNMADHGSELLLQDELYKWNPPQISTIVLSPGY
ncbi:MAG: hypothetical protein ACLU30_08205 [Odoribacter splanchnicus]